MEQLLYSWVGEGFTPCVLFFPFLWFGWKRIRGAAPTRAMLAYCFVSATLMTAIASWAATLLIGRATSPSPLHLAYPIFGSLLALWIFTRPARPAS